MKPVRAKKFLGQHFLNDEQIASRIVDSLSFDDAYKAVLEVGSGMGVLTKYLKNKNIELKAIEIDGESVNYLTRSAVLAEADIFQQDFLRMDLSTVFAEPFALIGNFPYNISSQIFFKVLDNKDTIPEVVGMLQKEVAERICAPPGSRTYGILSVFLQAFYTAEYLFTVNETVFIPPPKVKSGVIRLKRNNVLRLDCEWPLFVKTVKAAFSTRRKTLRNALKSLNLNPEIAGLKILDLRAEQLSVKDFVYLTNLIFPASADGKLVS